MSKPAPARPPPQDEPVPRKAALRKRRSLLVWLDKEMASHARIKAAPVVGRRPAGLDRWRRGGQLPSAASRFCLSIKVLFMPPLRQTAGMIAGLPHLAEPDRPGPDSSTPCRSRKTPTVQIPCRRARGPPNLLAHSSGIKFLGDDRWQARMHGVQGRRLRPIARTGDATRRRRKVDPAMDAPPRTVARCRSPPAGQETAPSCPSSQSC